MMIAAGCSHDPAGPQAAAGTLDARIDGEAWHSASAHASLAGRTLFVSARRDPNAVDEVMSFTLYDVTGPGGYGIGCINGASIDNAALRRGSVLYATPIPLGLVTTTVDSVAVTRLTADSVCGRFHFDLLRNADRTSKTTARVLDGSFAIPLTK